MMRINVWKVFVKLAKSRFALVFAALFACVWQASAVQWDTTRFEYEPGTGRLARKVYADGKAQFRPGFTHEDAKALVNRALQTARANGKIKPKELDKFIYDAGAEIGAHNGRLTSLIQLKVTPQGEIHVHPYSY